MNHVPEFTSTVDVRPDFPTVRDDMSWDELTALMFRNDKEVGHE